MTDPNEREQLVGELRSLVARYPHDDEHWPLRQFRAALAEIDELRETIDGATAQLNEQVATIAEQAAEIERLKKAVEFSKHCLETIVVTEGVDRGVVLLSQEAPTNWDAGAECYVYVHENFSPLGDGLIELYEILNATNSKPS